MSFASLCAFSYAYPVSFLSKCHVKNRKEVFAVRTSYRKEVLALLPRSRKEVLAVSRTQAQATHNQPKAANRSSCACIIFGLYCKPLGIERVQCHAIKIEIKNRALNEVKKLRYCKRQIKKTVIQV